MNVIINFEFKKFFHNNKNRIVAAMFAVCVFVFLNLSNSYDNSIRNNEAALIKMRIDGLEKDISNLEVLQIQNSGQYDFYSESIKTNENMLNILKDMYMHIEQEDRLSLLRDKIEYNNLNIELLSKPNIVSAISIDEIKKENVFLTYLADRNLEEINEQASVQADNAIILLSGYPAIIIIITAVFICADVLTSEFDNKTSYVLFSQPVKKHKIFFGKFLTSSVLITLFFTIFFILLYICLTIIKGGCQYNYPYIYYNGNNDSLIPAISFILLSFVIVYLLLFFVISLTFFISSLFKTTVAAASVTAVFIFMFYLLSSQGLLDGIAHLSPFSYLNVSSVINGEASRLFNNTGVIFINGVMVLMISIIVLLISGMIVFKNNTNNI